jgi:hypothetical protein
LGRISDQWTTDNTMGRGETNYQIRMLINHSTKYNFNFNQGRLSLIYLCMSEAEAPIQSQIHAQRKSRYYKLPSSNKLEPLLTLDTSRPTASFHPTKGQEWTVSVALPGSIIAKFVPLSSPLLKTHF